ncbi:hypothetical protein [Streptomyces sp. MB09-02B]|nr:hypothetical protein [Streptomyces sp. MB09-02B]MDX3642361.1 hypothetical protein [Streptomyces sp. MB09-02B]
MITHLTVAVSTRDDGLVTLVCSQWRTIDVEGTVTRLEGPS